MKLAQRVARIQPSATLTINSKAKALKQSGIQVINFGVGEPDFSTPANIKEAAVAAIWAGQTRYTPVSGIDELKEAVCGIVRSDYGLSYEKENVLICCGAKHAFYNLFQAVLDPGDEVIIPSPYWVSYPDMATLADAIPVIVPTHEAHGFKLQPEALEKAISASTRLFIMNSPANPTGAYYTRNELCELADVLLAHPDVMIATDDIYYRILFENREWINLAMANERLRDRTFIVNGVSKTYCMTGWRIGFLVGDARVIGAATKIQGQSTSNPTSIAQWASLAALKDDQSEGREMVKEFEARSRYVQSRLAQLPGVTCASPVGAFYVFPNVSCYYGKKAGGRVIRNSLDMADYLMELVHVAVVPGSAFGEDRCIRLSYALSSAEIEEGFDRLSNALKALA